MSHFAYYPDHLTPCQAWVKVWARLYRDQPHQAWDTFESAHRTAFIIMRATRPDATEERLIETLIQAQAT